MVDVHLGIGWNGAHRSLILGRRAAARNLEDLNYRIEEGERALETLRQQRAATVSEIEDHDMAIDRSGYVPPDGFDKWGHRIGRHECPSAGRGDD